jgi:hypothetical protein
MTQHNGWKPGGKAAYLIATFNDPGAHILHCVPTVTTYEEATAVLENRNGDQHLAEAFRAELMRRERHAGISLQEFAANIGHLAYRSYVDSAQHHISMEAARTLADEV